MRSFLYAIFSLLLSLVALFAANEDVSLEGYVAPAGDLKKAISEIRQLMTPEGKVMEDRSRSRLLIEDTAAAHQKIAKILKPWAAPARNIRITVLSTSPQRITQKNIDVSGQGRVGNIGVRVGDQPPTHNGISVRAQNGGAELNSSLGQQLLVMSGGKASITVADEVPDIGWFIAWGQPFHLWSSNPLPTKEVGARMVIEPSVVSDGMIKVKLTPSFSYFVGGQLVSTEVQQLSTEVYVANGADIDLGGIEMKDEEFHRKFLLSYDSMRNTRRVNFKLRASIEEMGPKPVYQEFSNPYK